MPENKDTLMEFPCDFNLKAFGKCDVSFEDLVRDIVDRHVPELSADAVSVRPSSKGNYHAATVKFVAVSQKQLDDLYTELSGHDDIIMVL